jgi:hypothetical protein
MKKRRSLTVLTGAIVLTIFGLGLAATQRENQKNKGQATTGYKITGTLEPIPGYSVPKSWGTGNLFHPSWKGCQVLGVRGRRWNNPDGACGFGLGQASH